MRGLLMAQVMRGRVYYWRVAVARYGELINYCRRFHQHEGRAIELLHDALLRGAAAFDPERARNEAAVFAFLKKVIERQYQDELRKQRSGQEVSLEEMNKELPDPGGGGLPGDEVLLGRMLLRALPDRLREVAVLRFFEGLSIKEIAEELEIAPGTVGRYLSDIKRRGREMLGLRREGRAKKAMKSCQAGRVRRIKVKILPRLTQKIGPLARINK